MSTATPLVIRHLTEPIAILSQNLDGLGALAGIVTVAGFLNHVEAVAQRLPAGQYAINLCENRYLFMVALCAVVVRKQTNLLPANKNSVTQKQLSEQYDNSYVVHDGVLELADLPHINLSLGQPTKSSFAHTAPSVELEHLAVICFTSGSTGDAKPNIKTWRTLVQSTAINSRYMLLNQSEIVYHLATVPGQHMWGLETSVLMALFSNVCLTDARPLYPHDIAKALGKLPKPRTLVSTPLHLRALSNSDVQVPALASVLCATAPLNQGLAQLIEKKFTTELREVYGCSEAGSMATRRTALADVWHRFDELKFVSNGQGVTAVSADHLPGETDLEDIIEMIDANRFRLTGRTGDQIKIAGKRGSLTEANKILLSFSGLSDGVVFFPPQDRTVPRLVALVVLQDGFSKEALRTHFRKHLDTAFVPRPILIVDKLPREENGKLTKLKLYEFYHSLSNLG